MLTLLSFCRLDDDLRSKVQDMDSLQSDISKKTEERARKLDKAMLVAEKFHREYHDVIRVLKDIQDNLISQDSPGVDVTTIKEQQKELAVQSLLYSLERCF